MHNHASYKNDASQENNNSQGNTTSVLNQQDKQGNVSGKNNVSALNTTQNLAPLLITAIMRLCSSPKPTAKRSSLIAVNTKNP